MCDLECCKRDALSVVTFKCCSIAYRDVGAGGILPTINRSSRKKRDIASNPLFITPDIFFCIFQTNFPLAILGLKEIGKFLWEGWKTSLPCWLSGRPFSLSSQRNFPISFKPKVAIAVFFWKMQIKICYSILWMDAMPLSLKNVLLRHTS